AIRRDLAAAPVPTPPPARPPGMSMTLIEGIQAPPTPPIDAPPIATPPIATPPIATPPIVEAPPIGPPPVVTPPVSRPTTVLVLPVAFAPVLVAAFLAFGPLGLFRSGGRPGATGPVAGSSSSPPVGSSHPVTVRTTPECTLKIAYVGTLNSTF